MNALFLMPIALNQQPTILSKILPAIYLVELGTCTLILVLIALLLTGRSNHPLVFSMIEMHFLGGGLACIGVLLLVPAPVMTSYPLGLLFAIGLLAGAGEAILISQWCDSFGEIRALSAAGISLAFLLGGILSILLSFIAPLPVRLAVIAMMPLASSLVLKKTAERSEKSERPETMQLEHWVVFKRPYTVFQTKLISATLLLSLILSSFRLLSGGELFSTYYVLSPPLAGAICLSIAIICMVFSKHYEYKYVYRLVMTLVFVGSMMLFVFNSKVFCDFLARTGLFCFELLFLPIAISFSSRSRKLAIMSVAIVEAAYMGAEMLGTLLVYYTPNSILTLFETVPLPVLILLALFFVYTYILNEASISDMDGWNADSNSIMPTLAEPKSHPQASLKELRAAEMANAIDDLARLHHLSPRETEVAALLASGCSRAQICNKLCISQGTTNSHISRIYQKVEVHNRDELSFAIEKRMSIRR